MDEYLSEREQWERVVARVREDGPWIVAAVAVAGLAFVGWRWWLARTERIDLDASARYEQILGAFDSGDRTRALELLDALAHDHPGSPYVDQGNLAAARVFVETNELERAAQRLDDVVEESHDHDLATIARLRLARVQIALGKPDAALATLATPPGPVFLERYEEIRGDAYYAKGDQAAALAAYRAARLAAGPSLAENDVLNLKIDDLTGESAPSSVARPTPLSPRAPAPAR
ncbi:MAG TPA: tetratricopeptide repeat protein [Steroidobacteraceae bacterium]|nr:tetratricopeptide repeat protein [Steroidobacteraceae bacterium]